MTRTVTDDHELWTEILESASTRGVDINNITFTEPPEICVTEACEHDLGGYNLNGEA